MQGNDVVEYGKDIFGFLKDETDENIEFDSNQEYEILSRKTDGYIYFIPENFNIYTVGDAQFFYRKNGSANMETCWN